ncbi:putative ribonuclease H-like domain-containing protein [Tanacetum coccineum]
MKLTKLINNQISVNNKSGVGFDSQINENELHDYHLNKSEVFESAFDSIMNEIEEENNQVNDRFKKVEGYHAITPPYTGNYMPSRPNVSFAGLDDSIYKTNVSETISSVPRIESTASKSSKDSLEQPKDVRPSAPIIEEWESDSDDDCVIRPSIEQNKPTENLRKSQSLRVDKTNWNGIMTQKLGNGFEFNKKACFVCGSLNHLIKDCNFYENKMVGKFVLNNMRRITGQREVRPVWNNAQRVNHQNKLTHPHPKRNFFPTTVLTKSGNVPVNTAKQSFPRAAVSNSTAMYVNTAASRPTMNGAKPSSNVFHKSHSSVKRTFYQRTAPKIGHEANAVKSSACWIRRPTRNFIDHISKDNGSYMLKRFDYGNPQYALQDQGIFDSGCSRHMTGNKFYLSDYQDIDGGFVAFGRSSKRGKITRKGKIRTDKLDFEDTECLVLSPDFKLLDESQALLKIPRQNNIYSFDLKNVVPSGGIKREFSVARTPQQNRVAERKNRTLIEAARTMLADSLLPTTFWVEAIDTACYVQNRVLITKPQNKTPYELLVSKFEGKADEGFLVGYSVNSKAFRVFNTRTKKVEENLHIKFLKNKPNVAGSGLEWLFDIDSLTKSMNYEPVTVGNQTNDDACIETNVNAVQTGQEKASNHEYILLPFLTSNSQGLKSSNDEFIDDAGKKNDAQYPAKDGDKNSHEKDVRDQEEALRKQFDQETKRLVGQGEATITNNTNRLNTVTPSVSAAGQSFDNNDLPTDPLMPDLEDSTGIFRGAYDDEDVGVEADLNNLETTMNVSPIPTTRIHKDHPKDQIIRDINSAIQTRRMIIFSEENAMVIQALTDSSWIEAMQEELLQFQLQKVWTLVDLPNGKRAIRTKWVFRNKKDERGIVIRNKARLVAQGYTQEEGIDYDEVFAPVARIKAIRLFLAYASFMIGLLYTIGMDVKSAFLYGTIEEEVYVCQPPSFEDPQFPNKTASTPTETNKALIKDEEAENVDVYLYRLMIGSLMYLTASRADIMFAVWIVQDSPFDLEAFSDSYYAGASLNRKSTTAGCQFLGKRLISWQLELKGANLGIKSKTSLKDLKDLLHLIRRFFKELLIIKDFKTNLDFKNNEHD